MATTEITKKNLEEHLKKEGILFLDFWASWCAPCRAFAPVYEAASKRHEDIVWGKVDTQANPELGKAFEVEAIPTIMAFRDGLMVFRHAGMLPAKALDEIVGKVREIDMEDVRRQIAKEDAAGHEHGADCKH